MIFSERLTRADKRIRGQIAFIILFQNTAQLSFHTIPDTYP
jgi:hypothetical protein